MMLHELLLRQFRKADEAEEEEKGGGHLPYEAREAHATRTCLQVALCCTACWRKREV